jgi:hypothetical protein
VIDSVGAKKRKEKRQQKEGTYIASTVDGRCSFSGGTRLDQRITILDLLMITMKLRQGKVEEQRKRGDSKKGYGTGIAWTKSKITACFLVIHTFYLVKNQFRHLKSTHKFDSRATKTKTRQRSNS